MSARIANAIAEVYLADQVDTKNEANRRATEWLEERLAELRRNLQVAEEAVATYRRDKGLAGSPEGAVSTQTLSDLNGKYIAARAKRIEKEARLVALSKASLNPDELANIAEVSRNATLAALRIQDVDLSRRMSRALRRATARTIPSMVQARSELASVRGRFLGADPAHHARRPRRARRGQVGGGGAQAAGRQGLGHLRRDQPVRSRIRSSSSARRSRTARSMRAS